MICTRNRPDDLARCLQSLQLLEPRLLEILVVDNAPEGAATRDVVARFSDVRYVAEPRPGLSRARMPACAARGSIVAFTDDDVRVTPNWVAAMEHGFRDASISVVTGLVLPAELQSDSQLIFELGAGGFGQGYQRRIYDPPILPSPPPLRCRYGESVLARAWRFGSRCSNALDFSTSASERCRGLQRRFRILVPGAGRWRHLLLRPSRRGAPLSPARNRGTQTPDVPVPAGPWRGLMIQFARHHHWGNLRRLVVDILTHQTKLAIKGVLRQTKHRRHLLASEVRGTSRESCITSATFTQPPYPGTDLENPPQAKVAGIDVVETPGDIALERGYRELWLLARRRETPLGWIRIPGLPGTGDARTTPFTPEPLRPGPAGWRIARRYPRLDPAHFGYRLYSVTGRRCYSAVWKALNAFAIRPGNSSLSIMRPATIPLPSSPHGSAPATSVKATGPQLGA